MVNEDPATDSRSRVDFYTGKNPAQMGDKAGRSSDLGQPQGVGKFMEKKGMKSWIAEDYFQPAAGRRILLKDIL
jgi:hypothetical protein